MARKTYLRKVERKIKIEKKYNTKKYKIQRLLLKSRYKRKIKAFSLKAVYTTFSSILYIK